MACRIVDSDSFEMFAFGIPLDEAVQASLLASAKFALDALLEAIGQDLRTAREIVAQDSPLVPYLITGENKRHAADAHDQGQDYFQSRAHLGSSIQEMKMDRERLGACGQVELRNACYSFSKNPFFSFNSPCLESRSSLDNDANCDVSAIRGAILHCGLGANLEFAFHFSVIVHQEFHSLSFLTLGDLEGKSRVANRRDFARLGWVVGGWSRPRWEQLIRNRCRPRGYSKAYNKQRG